MYRRIQIFSFIGLIAGPHSFADTAPDIKWAAPEQVARVARGECAEARADWWGFDVDDSTRFLQAALDSKAEKVIIPNLGSPWVTIPLRINRDNIEIFFEPGTLVLAKKGAFRGRLDFLFLVRDRKHVVFRGYGATLRMRKEDYVRSPYSKSEWRNIITLYGSHDVKILGLTLENSGGDGIFIGGGQQSYCSNTEIRDIVADRNFRQGISVVSAENLLIADSVLRGTSGTAPMAGIDLEPDRPNQRLVNVLLRNVRSEGNGFAGFFLFLSNLKSDSLPVSVRFENCISSNDFIGVALRQMGGTNAVRGVVEFVDVRTTGSHQTALLVDDKCATSSKISFERCFFGGSRGCAPLSFKGGANWGGLVFTDTVVEDWEERPVIAFSGEPKLTDVTGILRVRTPHAASTKILPETTRDNLAEAGLQVVLEQADVFHPLILDPLELPFLQQLCPVLDTPLDFVPDPVSIRCSHAYALYADQDEQVALTFESNRSSRRCEVEIIAPSGGRQEQDVLLGKQRRTIAFKAQETGVYLVSVAAPPYLGELTLSSTARLSVLPHLFNQQDIGYAPLIMSTGPLYFWVPKGTEMFRLRVGGHLSEPEGFSVVDPDGHVVAKLDKLNPVGETSLRQHTFTIQPDLEQTGRIWKLNHTSGIYRLMLFDPIPPVFAPHPDALLIPRGEVTIK